VFDAVRFGEEPSARYARFTEDGVPWIANQPDSQVAVCGRDIRFHFAVVQGYGVQVYQWRKDGVPVVDGPTGTGSTIIIDENNLDVRNVGPGDEGTYDCLITNLCGSATSNPGTLTVGGCCLGDLDGDGSVGLADLAILLAHFGHPNGANYSDGDLDGDGDVDLGDLASLLPAFGTVCP
jgi:hypothetical protein